MHSLRHKYNRYINNKLGMINPYYTPNHNLLWCGGDSADISKSQYIFLLIVHV